MTYQNPVKGRGCPTSLHVAQDGHPGVKTQAAYHQLDVEGERSGMTAYSEVYGVNVYNMSTIMSC